VATDACNAFLDILRCCAASIKKLAMAVNLYPALDGLCTVMDGWLRRLQSFPAGGDLTVRTLPFDGATADPEPNSTGSDRRHTAFRAKSYIEIDYLQIILYVIFTSRMDLESQSLPGACKMRENGEDNRGSRENRFSGIMRWFRGWNRMGSSA
jgi:hypothetical protein